MADQLNGRPNERPRDVDGHDQGRRPLRVAFAPGTRPGPGHPPAVVQVADPGRVTVDGRRSAATLTEFEAPRGRLVVATDGEGSSEHDVLLLRVPDLRRAAAGVGRIEVVVDGWHFELDVESELRARLRERATSARADAAQGGPSELRAIIPGRVISVDVAEGDIVEAGGRLLVLEAMKMQNELKAPRAGTVARLAVGPGQTVELGDVLLVIE